MEQKTQGTLGMKSRVPGIEVDFWKGTRRSTPEEADRGYVTGPGIFLTFPATLAGRKTMAQVLTAIDVAFAAGHARAKEDLRKWLSS